MEARNRASSKKVSVPPRWPLERMLFAMAGTVSIMAALLSVFVSKWFVLLGAFVGLNQWLYVLTGSCPASILLGRSCRFESVLSDRVDGAVVVGGIGAVASLSEVTR
jgi:hypothetical protein